MSDTDSRNNRKNRSVLGLAPLQASHGSLGLAPYSSEHNPSGRAITKREKRIVDTFHEQGLIVGLAAAKGKFGTQKLNEVQVFASEEFGSTLGSMHQNREELRSTDMYEYMDEFTERQIQMLARHMMGTLEITGVRIAEEIQRSLYLPPEEEGGFWARLLGRG